MEKELFRNPGLVISGYLGCGLKGVDAMEENTLGVCEGYIGEACPNCGRVRVEHWSCGKDICEKCHWCIQDNEYCMEHADV